MSRGSAREQFGATAQAYATSEIHARGDDLDAMVAYARHALDGLRGLRVLDVATGAGHTAVAFANAGAAVDAMDVTPEMLAVASEVVAAQVHDGSVALHEGRAEALPFEDASFDVVTCRIAAHHFDDPAVFVREARRVLAPSGRFLLVDNIAPEDAELAATMNRIEKARDRSHVRAYDLVAWLDWLHGMGFAVELLHRWRRRKDYAAWTARSGMSADAAEALAEEILALPEHAREYFLVEAEDGRLIALAHEVAFLAAR